MKYTATARSPQSSSASARLDFPLGADPALQFLLALPCIALLLAAASLGSLSPWQRGLLAAALLVPAASGIRRLIPGAHGAAASWIAFEAAEAGAMPAVRLRLRDGVERHATLCASSVVLPGIALLVCGFDRSAATLGPGQRLPRRVCVLLRAARHPPADWRLLQWRLRWPVQRRSGPPRPPPLG